MILSSKNTKGKKVEVFDVNGTSLGRWVSYFNTKTKLVKMYVQGLNPHFGKTRFVMADVKSSQKKNLEARRKLVQVSFKLPGAYAVVDGKVISK